MERHYGVLIEIRIGSASPNLHLECIKVIVAEDLSPIRTRIINILSKVPEIKVIAEVADGDQLVEESLIHEPEAVFVDIGMPGLDGMQAVKSLLQELPNLFIIFITAHVSYAVEAFEISAIDYIVKPIETQRILKAVVKLKQHLIRTESAEARFQKLSIKCNGDIFFIDPSNIYMLEKEDKNIIIHTTKGVLKTTDTIKKLKEDLKKFNFFQTHRSFLINLDKVEKILSVGDRIGEIRFTGYDKVAYVSRYYLHKLNYLLETKI